MNEIVWRGTGTVDEDTQYKIATTANETANAEMWRGIKAINVVMIDLQRGSSVSERRCGKSLRRKVVSKNENASYRRAGARSDQDL